MKRILVAIDFSSATDKVIATASELAAVHDASLRIIHTEPPELEYIAYGAEQPLAYGAPMPAPEFSTHTAQEDRKALNRIKKQLDKQGLTAECVQLEGHTAEVILAEADDYDADMIIIGTHEHGLFYYLLLGGVRDSVLKDAKVPVLVVPANSNN
jgi:nucleotide-binding universal stress UspA family protein